MKCPVDAGVDLVMSERQGVEIDYCPTCRGVWLDRGELDKILDRAAGLVSAPAAVPPPATTSASLPYDDAPRFDPNYGDTRSASRYDQSRDDDDRRSDSRYDPRYRDDDRDRRDDRGRPGYKKKRKESWLGDILDFG